MEFLAGSTRDRIIDLCQARGYTQKRLAEAIGEDAACISRIVNGKNQKIDSGIIEKIADEFQVTTDFILGRTDAPERTTYHIDQLGLSVKAAGNLYTGKANPEIVSRLLESPAFCSLTYGIERYLEERLADGIAVQNKLFENIGMILCREGMADCPKTAENMQDAKRDILAMRRKPNEIALDQLVGQFKDCLLILKRKEGSSLEGQMVATDQMMNEIISRMKKNSDVPLSRMTPEDIANAIEEYLRDCKCISEEQLTAFRSLFLSMIQASI